MRGQTQGYQTLITLLLGFFWALTRLQLFFCLLRLSRHYLPPVADYGEKDEREVRRSRTVQKG